MNPFLRQPSAFRRTPLRAERPDPKTGNGGVVTLRLYDPIDSWGEDWGVSSKEFAKALDELPDDTSEIRVLINSPGGECWEGLAILNMLRAHPAKVVAVVEGIAGSAASFIAAGVDELEVMANAEIFVHRAWGGAIGNAETMAKMAADLAHEDRNIASIYAGKAGGTVDDWLAAMSAETFYSAEEAVEAGLADRVVKPPKGDDAASKAKNRWDRGMFTNRIRASATDPPPADHPDAPPTPPDPGGVSSSPATEPTPPQEDQMPLSADALQALGLADDADSDAVNAAILAAVGSGKPTDPPAEPAPTPAPTPRPEPVVEPVKPAEPAPVKSEPVASLDAEAKAEIARLSQELAEIRAEKKAGEKKTLFDSALQAGKLKPADRAQWENRYDKAPEVIADILASIADGTEVPVNAAGFTGTDEVDTDAEFERLMARLDGPTAGKGV